MEKKFPVKVWLRTFSVLLILVSLVVGSTLLQNYVKVQAARPVKPPFAMPTSSGSTEQLYEYCILPPTPSPQDQLNAGTPIPLTPVSNGATWNAATPTPSPQTDLTHIEFSPVNVGKFQEQNFHIVVVGVGYTPEENGAELTKMIESLGSIFEKINIDFAYVSPPINIPLGQNGVTVLFADDKNRETILAEIKSVYPIDSLIVAVKTNTFFATSLMGGQTLIVSGNSSLPAFTAHEIGHQLRMEDAYPKYNHPGKIPNAELFYADEMPPYLAKALKELDYFPPMYLVGTCRGRKVYMFYEMTNDIYGTLNPKGPNSWGNSVFTPLQIQIMNDYIAELRSGK